MSNYNDDRYDSEYDNDRQDSLGDAAFLSGVAKFPQRIKCATLAWNALKTLKFLGQH